MISKGETLIIFSNCMFLQFSNLIQCDLQSTLGTTSGCSCINNFINYLFTCFSQRNKPIPILSLFLFPLISVNCCKCRNQLCKARVWRFKMPSPVPSPARALGNSWVHFQLPIASAYHMEFWKPLFELPGCKNIPK